jgi:hypothetical protein
MPAIAPPTPLAQKALIDAQAAMPAFHAAVQQHEAALAAGNFDRGSLSDIEKISVPLFRNLEDACSGTYPLPADRRDVVAGLAASVATDLSGFGRMWAAPGEDGMKPVVNVRLGAQALLADTKRPDFNLIMAEQGDGDLSQVANGLRNLWAELGDTNPSGTDYRLAGDGRAAADSAERLTNGLVAASQNEPFRASKQVETSVAQLQGVLAESGNDIPQPQRDALTSAISGALAATDLSGRSLPKGPAAYEDAAKALQSAALGATTALDKAALPYYSQPNGADLAQWRQNRTVSSDGYYYDPDISGDG